MRFAREANTLARLRHRNVLPIHEVGELNGQPYLVVPLALTSLDDVLEREGPLDPERVAICGAKLARALDFVHQAGVLHRDVKPANVLLLDEEPVLADFGLTKDLAAPEDHLSQTGAMHGSPGYWSPEQASGLRHDLGPATDVYSLGATLYALLTGRPPCWGDTITKVAERTLHQPPLRPSRLRPGIGRALEDLVLRCLEKEPARRPSSAAEVASALEAIVVAETARGSRGGLLLPLLAAGAALAFALGGAWVLLAPGSAPAPQRPTPDRPRIDWVATGHEQLERGDLEGVAASLERALADDPSDVAAHALSAWRWLALDDPPRARADAERALELEPGNEFARAARIDVLLTQGSLREGLAASEALLAAVPDSAWGHCLRSRALQALGQGTEALQEAEQAQLLRPRWVEGALAEARARLQLEDADGARGAARRAWSLATGNPRALMLRARAELLAGDPEAALGTADELLGHHPRLPAAYTLRAIVFQQRGDLEAARRDADHALELAPNSARVWGGRGVIAWAEQDWEAALSDYTRALELAPDLREVRQSRALIHVNRQDFPAAIADYDHLLRVDPELGLIYSLRAASKIGVGDYEGAAEDYYAHLRYDPNNPITWETLGILERFAGDTQEALAAFDRAVEIEPTANRLVQRAAARQELGQLAEVRADLERALQLEPGHEEAQRLLRGLSAE